MKNARFNYSQRFNTGRSPVLIMDDQNHVITLFRATDSDTLYWQTGSADAYSTQWHQQQPYAHGAFPSLDKNDQNTLIAVHQSSGTPELWCQKGHYDQHNIQWEPVQSAGKGITPAIAVTNNNTALLIYRSPSNDTLWYRLGQIKNDAIEWLEEYLIDNGTHPSLTRVNNHLFLLAYVSPHNHRLMFRRMTLQDNQLKIDSLQILGRGTSPCISANNEGIVLLTCQDADKDVIHHHHGILDGEHLILESTLTSEPGINPSIALNSQLAVAIHQELIRNKLWCANSLIIDRTAWMSDNEALRKRPLCEICLPGTHDSGAYRLSPPKISDNEILHLWQETAFNIHRYIEGPHDEIETLSHDLLKDWGITQTHNIHFQLENGIRFLDIKPYCNQDKFNIHHALTGPDMRDILQQIALFVKNSPKEMIVLYISHFSNFTNDDHQRFIQLIKDILDPWLYHTHQPNLAEVTLEEITPNSSSVLVLYHDEYITINSASGIHHPPAMLYESSSSPSFKTMKQDQLSKLKANANIPDSFFVLNWVLSPNKETLIKDAELRMLPLEHHSDRQIESQRANTRLPLFIQEYGTHYRINVINTDFFQESRCTDMALMMNHLYAHWSKKITYHTESYTL